MLRIRVLLAAMAAVATAAATALPWCGPSRAPLDWDRPGAAPREAATWSGVELLGGPVTAVLWTAAAGAMLLAGRYATEPLRGLRRGAAVATAGAAGVGLAAALGVLVAWGPGQPGPWLASAAAISALAATVSGGSDRPALLAVVLVGVVAAALLPGAAPAPQPRPDSGPLRWLADLDPDLGEPPRSGTATLPSGRPTTIDGAPVVVSSRGAVGLDAAGRADVLGGTTRELLAVHDELVVSFDEESLTLYVTGLRPGDPRDVEVRGVVRTSPVGSDGSLWLTEAGPAEVMHRLDLSALPVTGVLDAAELPLVEPAGRSPFPEAAFPVPGGALRVDPASSRGGGRVRLLVPSGDDRDLVGGDDAACGYTGDPARTYLAHQGTYVRRALTVDTSGGVWFTDRTLGVERLLRLRPGGVLQSLDSPLPGRTHELHVAPDGGLLLVSDGSLWRLPDAVAAMNDLPAPAPDCGTQRRPAAPPATVSPVDVVVGDRQVLDVTGRSLDQSDPNGAVVAVEADGSRVPLGRRDGTPAAMYPDGRGGVWWLETDGDRETLVHGRPGLPEERTGVPRGVSYISGPDLSGRPPLLCGDGEAFRLVDGEVVPVADDCAHAAFTGPDGRGWVLLDGRLRTLDGDRPGPPVIDPGPLTPDPTPVPVPVPVPVQLALGTPPTALAVESVSQNLTLGVDGSGRALLVVDQVLLRADRDGRVEVLAETSSTPVDAVEDGLVQVDDDGLRRIVLPA